MLACKRRGHFGIHGQKSWQMAAKPAKIDACYIHRGHLVGQALANIADKD